MAPWKVTFLAALLCPGVVLADDGRTVRTFEHGAVVRPVVFSPDGKTLATGGYDRKVKLWDVASGEMKRELAVTHPLLALAFSRDGRRLAAGTHTGELTVFEVGTGKKLFATLTGRGNISGLSWSLDGKTLATADYDGGIGIWDATAGKRLKPLRGHSERAWAVAYSPDGSLLASVGGDAITRLWDPAIGKEVQTLGGHISGAAGVAFSRDGRLLVTAGADGTFHLHEVLTGQRIFRMNGTGPHSAVFSPDARLIVGATRDAELLLFDAVTGKEVGQLKGHRAWTLGVAFSPDGKWIASGSQDKTARLWKAEGLLPPRAPSALAESEREKLWKDLMGDCDVAHRAVWGLANDTGVAGFLEKHLRPVEALSTEEKRKRLARVTELIRDLDGDAARQDRAMAELESLGEAALPALRRAQEKATSLDVLTRTAVLIDRAERRALDWARLRERRAVASLERAGDPASRALLKKLAAGDPQSPLTREASAALGRIGR